MKSTCWMFVAAILSGVLATGPSHAEQVNVFAPVADSESFADVKARMAKDKDQIVATHQALLETRYDLSDRSSKIRMSRGKSVQTGVRVRLPEGASWDQLASMLPQQIREEGLFPAGFLPLPHPIYMTADY